MDHLVLRNFFSYIIFIFLTANIGFAQSPAHPLINPVLAQLTNRVKVTPAKPKVRPLHNKIPTKVFGNPSNSDILKHQTVTTGNKTKISFDIELGEPIFVKSTDNVVGAEGKQFGMLNWSNFHIDKLPSGVNYLTIGKPGEPEIPSISITIAVPEGAENITPYLQQRSTKSLTNIFLLPKADSKSVRTYSPKNYLSPSNETPVLSAPAKIRTMRLVSLTVPLAEFGASNGTIKAKNKISCGVTFDLPSGIVMSSVNRNADPVFEKMYSLLAANSSDINRYRTSFHSHPTNNKIQTANISPTFDKSITNWIDPNSQYLKLSATRTGLYRVTATEIQTRSGFDISNWRQSEVRMFNKGKEVPIWIDSTSSGLVNAIEYYGERLPGYPGEFLNWDSDSNAYWLTNSRKFQTVPKRYSDKVVAGNPSLIVSEGDITLHHEQDNFYYGGDAGGDETATLQRCEWVPGERFIWQYLPNRHNDADVLQASDSFMISSLPGDISGKSAQLIVFLRGVSTSNSGSVIHKGTISINGNDFSVSFKDFNEIRDTINIPFSILKSGANTFQIQYKPGSGTPDKWYFDYYSVSLPSTLTASSDTAIARGQWAFSVVPSQSQFVISLQSSGETPHLYNLLDNTKLIASGTNYKDASTSLTSYAAATPSTFLHPDRIVTATGTFAALLDTTQGADYIIITHPLFLTSAQKLASRRQLMGLRTKVVTTDDIFNTFNFGSDEPWALRRYLQYAFDFYAGVPPSLVTLFGDATWDPKFNLNNPLQEESAKTIHRSFVPTFGVPNSDYIFSTVEGSGLVDSSSFEMVISRIPVESVDEGESYLHKLVEYESSAPTPWNKNFLFVAGGDAPFQYGILLNLEHAFVGDSTAPGNQFGGLGNPPISIKPTFIFRHDLIDQIDISQIPAIQTAFTEGQSLVYFFGHGAPNITDVQFPDVGTLNNAGTYPVFITVSCRTGAFAEPNLISMNESFVRVPEAGAILAFGSTGFGEVNYDFNMSAHIFNFMRGDSSLRMPRTGPHKINFPMMFTAAKFMESVVAPYSGGFGQHNSLYEYSILGDAAIGFDLRPQPEFNITTADIILSGKDGTPRSIFSLSDSQVIVKANIHNFGYGITKPVHIRITDNQLGNRQIVLIDTVEKLENLATTGAIFSLDSFAIGTNTLDIFVDYDNQFAETDENDNEASVTFLVNSNSGTPFYPPEGAKYFCDIRTDSVNFILLLPNNKSGATIIQLQFDTTSAFNSKALVDLGGLQGSGLFFQKAIAQSALPTTSSHVIWWRSRITLPNGNQSNWQVRSVSLDAAKPPGARSEFSYSTADQLETIIISGLQIDRSDGALFIPSNDTVGYDVEARGQHDVNVVGQLPVGEVLINRIPVYTTPYINGQFTAYTLLELTPDESGIEQVFQFLTPPDSVQLQTALAKNFSDVVNAIPNGRKVIVLTNFQPFIPNFTNSDIVRSALQSLGSLDGISSLAYFGSYVLIGEKGFAKGLAKEKFSGDGTNGVSVLDTFITAGTSGFAQTPLTAVAMRYGKLRWGVENLNSGSTIKFTVLGTRKTTGSIDTLLNTDASTGTTADLSVNPATFDDKLFVQMNFHRSSSSTISPRLKLIELEYDAAPEFSMQDSFISVVPMTVLEGNPVKATYTVQNVTCIDAQNVSVQFIQTFHGNAVILATDTITNFLGHSSVTFTHSIQTHGFKGDINLTATVNPGGILNEQLLFNNTANTVYTVVRDSAKPKLDLQFDGRHINSGDFVSSTVQIEIRLSDNSPLRVTDSSSISGVLQALFGSKGPISFSAAVKNDSFTTKFTTLSSGTVQAILDITPLKALQPGRYLFTAMGHDASGNRSDTISDEFVISGTNGLDHVMNYPNPFKDKTWFTFILKTASQAEVRVLVYTVAGRKIRTLHLDPMKQRAGLNSIEWDGRDDIGNEVANGTYLYRIVLNGTNDDGSLSSDATTERAVRSR